MKKMEENSKKLSQDLKKDMEENSKKMEKKMDSAKEDLNKKLDSTREESSKERKEDNHSLNKKLRTFEGGQPVFERRIQINQGRID